MRYSDGQAGIAVTVSDLAIDYLKVIYLPYLYDKIQNFDLPENHFSFGPIDGTISPVFYIPEPSQLFIENWSTQFDSQSNSLKIQNSQQELDIVSNIKLGGRGHC